MLLIANFIVAVFAAQFTATDNAHILYYLRYGNLQFDGRWVHWNHSAIPHWQSEINAVYNVRRAHNPPDDIYSQYYPAKGCYSSRDPAIIRSHFQEIRKAGVKVVMVSWFGRYVDENQNDPQGVNVNSLLPSLFEIAQEVDVRLAFHLEPYSTRTVESVREDVVYLLDRFGDSPALYRTTFGQKQRPVFYVYDSYILPHEQWAKMLSPSGVHTVRNTKYDSTFIGLWLNQNDGDALLRGGFDGAYTYFAQTGVSWGSTPNNWFQIRYWATVNKKLFVASVGPGYNDEATRPWNHANTKPRNDGQYYQQMFEQAIEARPDTISITSFNEWGEGTQIEPAVPKIVLLTSEAEPSKNLKIAAGGTQLNLAAAKLGSRKYESYPDPYFYLNETLKHIQLYQTRRIKTIHDEL